MKKSKQALFHSVIALLLCFSMFVGTTFAWFTDSVTSTNNIIASGNLDVELEWYSEAVNDWLPVTETTNVFAENTLWEPGHTEVVYLRISNKGSLALKYQLGVNVAFEVKGTNVYDKQFKLSDYIEMGAVKNATPTYATRDDARKAVTTSGTLASGYATTGSMKAGDPAQYLALVVFMPEEVDNVANYKTGTTAPEINLGVTLLATQLNAETDSFGPDYDAAAKHPLGDVDFTSTQSIADVVENGALTEDVTVGSTSGGIYAEVPADVKLADGADSLELVVQAMKESEADIQLEIGESKQSFNIAVKGVAEDNTVPMLITVENMFSPNLNSTSVAMYHVENGVTVAMTAVALSELDAHNEFYYDVATGNVTMAVATFSEYVTVENNLNPWTGKADTTWYNESADEYTLTTAEQLAGFGLLGDGGNDFSGKTVYLGKDIDLYGTDDAGNVLSFNPIGAYYPGHENAKIFRGTFDGQGYAVKNLKQNGWELGLSYTNAGGGLFAGVQNATIKNLYMQGADIVMEAVPMGTVAAYAYGSCTFENIWVTDSTLQNYNWDIAGIVGGVNGQHTFSNIHVDNTVTLSSLWGSFGGGIGGIIGSVYGGNNGSNSVTMNNVEVACVLDVYNDVTSAYQWYAYRFCGMLIGNTNEPDADGKNAYIAAASFLTCKNVKVYYGDWVDYTYCQFTNQSNADGSVDWQNNYPWVREQVGLSNPSYSNARYGHPVVDSVPITSADHSHAVGDQCHVLITFNQLYGGDQGVYGQPEHDGVTIIKYKYTVTYIDNDKVLYIDYVTDNSTAHTLLTKDELAEIYTSEKSLRVWENAYSQEFTQIPAGNSDDYVLYPKWEGEYVVRFLTADETVVGWGVIKSGETITVTAPAVPALDGFDGYWGTVVDGTVVDWATWSGQMQTLDDDVLFYAYYDSATLSLVPIFDEDGIQIAYGIDGIKDTSSVNVEIPDYVNGYPVTTIMDGTFSEFSNLTTVTIPATVTEIGADAFADKEVETTIVKHIKREQITIYYQGTKAQWDALIQDSNEEWDQWLGEGTHVFFVDEAGNVQDGYYEYVFTTEDSDGYYKFGSGWVEPVPGELKWVWHEHAYGTTEGCSEEHIKTSE